MHPLLAQVEPPYELFGRRADHDIARQTLGVEAAVDCATGIRSLGRSSATILAVDCSIDRPFAEEEPLVWECTPR